MRKKAVIPVVLVFCIAGYFFFHKQPTPPYDDYERMRELAGLPAEALVEMGYSEDDISKITAFPRAYEHYRVLQSFLEEGTYRNIGYRDAPFGNAPSVKKTDLLTDSELDFCLSVPDYFMEESSGQYKGRILTEFALQQEPAAGTYFLEISYPNFAVEAVYSLLTYTQRSSPEKYVTYMIALPDSNFYSELSCEIEAKKEYGGETYVLASGILILDVESDIMGPDIQFGNGFQAALGKVDFLQKPRELCRERVIISN